MFGIILALCVIISIEIITRNYTSIKYHIDSVLGRTKLVGLVTPKYVIDEVVRIIKKINNAQTYRFIDFGSSEGEIIFSIYPYVGQAIGIEFYPVLHRRALTRHHAIGVNNATNIYFLNMDMVNYQFAPVNTILYLYEPLWQMPEKEAAELYAAVFDNLAKIKGSANIYIIYCSGTGTEQLPPHFFYNYGYTQLAAKKMQYSRIIPITSRTLYLYFAGI